MLGGARSGKSGHAEGLFAGGVFAGESAVRYLATGRRHPDDADWDARIERHRLRRPAHWATVEGQPLPAALAADRHTPTLVDDLGTWLAGVFDDTGCWDGDPAPVLDHTARLVAAVAAYRGPLALVSPEVGMGIVPATRAGRVFRDQIGALNARVAEVCDRVVLVVAGLPLTLK